jgi:hypothetical protein
MACAAWSNRRGHGPPWRVPLRPDGPRIGAGGVEGGRSKQRPYGLAQ